MSKKIVLRANFIVFGTLIALLAMTGLLIWNRIAEVRAARHWTLHTYEVLGSISAMQITVRDVQISQRNYLLTGDPPLLASYNTSLGHIPALLARLQLLTADNPEQQARLAPLALAWQRTAQQFAQNLQVRRDNGPEAAIALLRKPDEAQVLSGIDDMLAAMTAEEQKLLDDRMATAESRGTWVQRLVLMATIVGILIILWAARLLSLAYQQSSKLEADQRSLATQLRGSLDSLSQGVGVFGPEHTLRHWNDCFKALLGLPPALVSVDQPYPALVDHFATDGGSLLETAEQIAHSQPFDGEPIVYEISLADRRQLEIRRTPTSDGGFVLTISDMTRRVQAEAVLRDSQKMQAIGQLTGGIAHDFNNLLTIILGNLELARLKLDKQSPVFLHLERSLWAAQRGGSLTQQLLAFARKQALEPAPIDLAATVPQLVPLLQRTLGEHIEVRFIDSAGLWPAMADPAQLESAVLNLALNARDAMPGGGRLTIELANKVLDHQYARAHTEVSAGDYVMVAVSDTGHGMTPDILDRVFEPFFTTKEAGSGTGLGLPMVFGFVKQSGGHVKIYSEPGEGTSVKLYLPRAISSVSPAVQRTSIPADLPRGSATILVVEDEAGVREIAVTILRTLGYHVLQAADGDEGLRVFGAHAPEIDMLLTDVVLPGKIRGRDLAERMTAMRPELRVLFMSGYTENSIVHHGRLDDGVHLLGKPFKREQLARKVAEVLSEGATAADAGNVVDLRTRRQE